MLKWGILLHYSFMLDEKKPKTGLLFGSMFQFPCMDFLA
ncbi:hypothetical protein EJK55_1930 [Moraxella catarrhalis]|uniref:Uncharacterized protein n=1 Tax=Moraxella catarrhalis TaxID=480 RepID=A0ABY0BLM5_MORCA|nr:hypothetical protein [Moraxella phage Mcat25]AKI28361.1 hypothetical protein [Moraxella phage Mcat29]AKI28367.1 hypothetical protein [Moraxella phage Mcat30]AKI28455.1 hypothetical protein [Moraxella phage Mcat31]RUO11968.1 hypothetical protein EJK55_1930 [Moraxella catarrhalis]